MYSATPAISSSTPASSQPQVTLQSTKTLPKDGGTVSVEPSSVTPAVADNVSKSSATSIPIPSRTTPAQTRPSPAPVEAPERPPEPLQGPSHGEHQQPTESRPVSEPTIVSPNPNEPNLMYSDFASSSIHRPASKERQLSASTNQTTATISLIPDAPREEAEARAAKRRKVERLPHHGPDTPTLAPEASANVPIPTTEPSEAVAGAQAGVSVDSALVGAKKPRKPRLSAQSRRTRQIRNAADEVVADATRNSSAKAKQPRKRANGKAVQGPEGHVSELVTGPFPEVTGQTDANAAAPKPKRNCRKRKANQSIQDAAAEVVEEAIQGTSKDPKKRGRKRAVTPEGADKVVISPSKMKMSDLCTDTRTGRKSELEKNLEEFEQAEFVRKKQKELRELMGQNESESQRETSETAGARAERSDRQRQREESVAQNVPNTIIVNGEIQIDPTSLQIDRHAEAAAERDIEQLETVDETDLTRKVNSGSWLKRDKSGGWNELLTERFYDGLRMFGTDFEMISKMFPGRTRHKIKLKFVKEEKLNYEKIKATLLGEKIPVDLPELEKMAGVEFDDPKELEKDMEEDRRRLEEETLAEKQAIDEARREREEEIAAERAAGGEEDSSGKENRRGKIKRKKGEKRKGSKGPSKRKEKKANRTSSSGRENSRGELGEMSGA